MRDYRLVSSVRLTMPAIKMRDFLAVELLMTVGAIKRAFFLAARCFFRVLSTGMAVLVDRNLG